MNISTVTPEGRPKTAEEVDQERIRRLAYTLFEKRGKGDGSDLDDWLLAESELTAKKPLHT